MAQRVAVLAQHLGLHLEPVRLERSRGDRRQRVHADERPPEAEDRREGAARRRLGHDVAVAHGRQRRAAPVERVDPVRVFQEHERPRAADGPQKDLEHGAPQPLPRRGARPVDALGRGALRVRGVELRRRDQHLERRGRQRADDAGPEEEEDDGEEALALRRRGQVAVADGRQRDDGEVERLADGPPLQGAEERAREQQARGEEAAAARDGRARVARRVDRDARLRRVHRVRVARRVVLDLDEQAPRAPQRRPRRRQQRVARPRQRVARRRPAPLERGPRPPLRRRRGRAVALAPLVERRPLEAGPQRRRLVAGLVPAAAERHARTRGARAGVGHWRLFLFSALCASACGSSPCSLKASLTTFYATGVRDASRARDGAKTRSRPCQRRRLFYVFKNPSPGRRPPRPPRLARAAPTPSPASRCPRPWPSRCPRPSASRTRARRGSGRGP